MSTDERNRNSSSGSTEDRSMGVLQNPVELTPSAFRLNGGKPMALGFNVKFHLKRFDKNEAKRIFEQPDSSIFPEGLAKVNMRELASFTGQIEKPLMAWLKKKENTVLFTTNPVQSVLKVAEENRIAIPPGLRAHLTEVVNLSAQMMPKAPGVKFNSVLSVLAQNIRKNG